MKRTFLIFIAIIGLGIGVNAQIRIAVLDFKARTGISQSEVEGISAIFSTYFNNPSKFTLIERTRIDKVVSEQGFQYSSLTESQAVKLGEILNVSKIVIGEVSIISGQYNVDARIVNVQTGIVDGGDGATWVQGTSYRELMKNLATRLMAKIDFTQPITPVTPVAKKVITLLGYLHVYPEDIGEFPTIPTNVISAINKQAMYGYNTWRVPTREEFALIKANSNYLGLKGDNYITSDGITNGNVLLVTTGKTASEIQNEKQAIQNERHAKRQEIINTGKGVEIGGLIWATGNVKNGKIVASHEYGEYYDSETAKNACPEGWRLPTIEELITLKNVTNRWTTTPVPGRIFGNHNTIFLPAAGYGNINANVSIKDGGLYGNYYSSTEGWRYAGTLKYLYFGSDFVETNESRNSYSVRCVLK